MQIKYQSKINNLIPKLTALWAVSESGLGGIMHASKLPFSGILLGGFSVIIITFLASNSKYKWKAILQATLLVVMIKAMISPHSPLMAYTALVFQGVLGALIYQLMGVNSFSAVLFGGIALLESAFQKIFTLTLIFGMHIWDAFTAFFESLTNEFQYDFIDKIPYVFIFAYGFLYLIAGIIIGRLAFILPNKIKIYALKLKDLNLNIKQENTKKKKGRFTKILYFLGILFFILSVFIFVGDTKKIPATLLRTFAALAFFLYILNPIFKFLLRRWVKSKKGKKQNAINNIFKEMPQIRENLSISRQLTENVKNPIKRAKYLLLNWIALSLYFEKK